VIKLSDYVFRRVAEAGVRHVFMLAGGGCMHLVESLGSNQTLTYVANLHEQGAAIAAEAYGQYTNSLGAALVTTGPGGTNALTGVAGAWLDSTPCLFISGQVKRADLKDESGCRQIGFQELGILELVSPVTKYAVRVDEPESIAYHLDRALHLARTGRPGPVWVDIPLDVQAAMIDEPSLPRWVPDPPAPDPDLADQAAEIVRLLEASQRPVVLVGNGVRLAGAERTFVELVRVLQAPVLTTWKTVDFLDDDDPLYCGRPGSIGQRAANLTQQNADLLIVIGARLDFGQTGYRHDSFARGARKVVVDVDATEISKLSMHIDVAVASDAAPVIAALLEYAGAIDATRWAGWLAHCKDLQARYPVLLPEFLEQADGVNTYVLIDALSDAMKAEDVLVPGSSGTCSEMTMQSFRVKLGQRVLNTEGLGSMGFAVPAALGACLASAGRRTISIEGDGSFAMNAQELEVIRRLGLPVKIFVLNNDGYVSIKSTQRNYFGGHLVGSDPSSGLTLPETSMIAAAYGIAFARLDSPAGIGDSVAAILDAPGPTICEVMVSPQTQTQPRLSSAAGPDGRMVSKPLEDLWPFLDRDEFAGVMIVPPLDEE